MKRLALLLALVAAISLSGQALAGAATFKGKIHKGGRVAFELRKNKRGERRIVQWRWHDLPIDCGANGTHKHDGKFGANRMDVNADRHFHAELVNEQYQNTATVDGWFPENWGRATGTLQVLGGTVWGPNCDSGPVDWTAKKT